MPAADDVVQDLRYAVRTLTRHKGFALTAVVTLALGIGANTAIFSVVNGVILRPLPFPKPERLIQLYETSPLVPDGGGVGEPLRNAVARESASVEATAAYGVSARYLRDGDGVRRVMAVGAERTFFTVLGTAPIVGRTFGLEDPAAVAVVSEGFWRQRLAGDPAAIGRTITLDGDAFTVIGVMPEMFQFPYHAGALLTGVATERRTDLWTPIGEVGQPVRGRPSVVGRLKAGATPAAAQSELDVIAKRLATALPDAFRDHGARLRPLGEVVVTRTIRRPLLILFGAVVLVLALACANVTNLSLVRMTLRSREMALRTALGASPLRLVRQLLTESLFVALVGGVFGLSLAWWGTRRLTMFAAPLLPRAREVAFDWPVFLFSLAACVFTGLLFGLAPAVIALRTNTQRVLQESGGHSTMGAGQRRLRDGLVVAEEALAFALALGATLLIRELVRLRATDTGMVTTNVVTAHLGQRMTPQTNVLQYYEIADRVRQLPGVRAAGLTQLLPLQNWGWTSNSTDFRVRGLGAEPGVFPIELRYVTPGYFEALGIRVRQGRAFDERDTRDAPRVIVINETLARRYFGDANPIDAATTRGTIVGVIADVHQVHLDRASAPEIYYPAAQNWSQTSDLGMTLVVRTEGRPDLAIDGIRRIVREVNPNLSVFDVKTMDAVIGESLADFTLYLLLMTGFALLALALAATGTYGVLAYVVSSRRREFAVRVALGASRARVTRLVFRQGLQLTAIGLALGWLATLAAAPLLQNLPVSVRPPDAATVAPVAALIGLVAIVACLVPAVRAARVEPMTALRQD